MMKGDTWYKDEFLLVLVIIVIFGVGAIAYSLWDTYSNPIEERCTEKCEMIDALFFKYDEGGLFHSGSCWCLTEPNKEPINIGRV